MFSANFQKKSLAKRLDHSHTIEIASSSRINAIIKEQYNRNRGHYLLGRAKTGTIMNKLVQKQISLISDSIIIQDLNDDAAPIKNGNYTPRAVFNFQPRLSTSIKRSLSLGFVFPESDATILCNLKKHLNFLQKEIGSGCLGNTILEWKETDCSLLKEYSINRSLQLEVIALGLREMLGGCDKQKQFSQIQELLCDNAELIFKEVTKSTLSWHPRIIALVSPEKSLLMNTSIFYSSLRKNNERLERLLKTILQKKSCSLRAEIFFRKNSHYSSFIFG
eukprot:TRINITY_DN42633_c0_g1_i1.p1 TRINITY_DN42633_c0_g1~~TRINITY_DN42633_c0_g1_i1.p1  ORF type:complete len:277 (-),score=26.31 TRINITY_DN42633_c0_g1_i1:156-986(-)